MRRACTSRTVAAGCCGGHNKGGEANRPGKRSPLHPRHDMTPASRRLVLLVADGIEGAMGDDPDARKWVKRLRLAASK